MNFPLIEKLGLEIEFKEGPYDVLNRTDMVPVVRAMDLEKILEAAPTVQGFRIGSWVMREQNHYDTIPRGRVDTHTAKLIMIEPIVEKEISVTRSKMEAALKNIGLVRHDNEDLFKELGL